MAGTLYVVATPIGNLEDITYRAVRILGECDLVACEDTRRTQRLLDHFGVKRPLLSLHEHNETERAGDIASRIENGANVAVVSDAGTPLISDPGYRVVKAALDRGLPVVPIPGASSVMTALSAAGLPTDQFEFHGFLPPKSHSRRETLSAWKDTTATVIFFEAPHRILETLTDIEELLPHHPVVTARELTKIHEEFLRGTAAEVRAILTARPAVQGEFTVLIGRPPKVRLSAQSPDEIAELVRRKMAEGLPRMAAIKRVAKTLGLPKGTVYDSFGDAG